MDQMPCLKSVYIDHDLESVELINNEHKITTFFLSFLLYTMQIWEE